MTNLLKNVVASASIASQNAKSYINMPTFKASDSSSAVIRKLNDYKAKVRNASSTLTHDEIIKIMAYDKELEFFEFANISQVTSGDSIKRTFIRILPQFARSKNIDVQFVEKILNDSLVVKVNRGNCKKPSYFAIIDDTKLKIKVKEELWAYYLRDYLTYYFGVVTVSTLESVAGLQLENPFERPWFTQKAIADEVVKTYEDAWFDDLNNILSFNSGKKIATVRCDKKYQDEILNKTTIFNQLGFNKVEVDTAKYDGQTFDYRAFKDIEKNWQEICNLLPHTVEPELKFRKLGKHKATGLYVPIMDIVAVDVRDTTSFIHEYGHHIDFTFRKGANALSREKAFAHIQATYKNKFQEIISTEDSVNGYYVKKFDYFVTPTEVFARGFEVWFAHRYSDVESVLSKKLSSMVTPEYAIYNDMLEEVLNYFDNLYAENKSEDYTDYVVQQELSTHLKTVAHHFKEVEPTNVGVQLSLF